MLTIYHDTYCTYLPPPDGMLNMHHDTYLTYLPADTMLIMPRDTYLPTYQLM
jgi:hypothetical protein